METIPIFDGHNDTLLKLRLPERGGERDFFERGDLGHIDLPRAREGGFFACYVPNPDDEWTEESALTHRRTPVLLKCSSEPGDHHLPPLASR